MSGRRGTSSKGLNLASLEVASLQRYAKKYRLPVAGNRTDLEQHINRHFSGQQFMMDEEEVLIAFIKAVKNSSSGSQAHTHAAAHHHHHAHHHAHHASHHQSRTPPPAARQQHQAAHPPPQAMATGGFRPVPLMATAYLGVGPIPMRR